MEKIHNQAWKSLIPIWLAVIGITTLILFGAWQYYSYEKKQIEADKFNDLKAISDLKVNQIQQWMDERISEARFFSGNADFIDVAGKLVLKQAAIPVNYIEQLQYIQNEHAYENIFIVTADDEVVFEMNNASPYISEELQTTLDSVFLSKRMNNTGFYYSDKGKHVHLDIVAPLMKEDEIFAALVFRILPETYLYPLIQDWPTASNTSETLIVRDEGDSVLFLNELRHRKNTAVKLKVSKKDTIIPAVAAVNGYEGIFEGKDYRGVQVLSYVRDIPDWPWFMVAKMDKNELLQELSYKTSVIIILIVILLLTILAAAAWIFNQRQKQTYRGLYLKEKELGESQEALAKSEEKYRFLAENSIDVVWQTDLRLKFIYVSPSVRFLLGYRPEKMTGSHIWQFMEWKEFAKMGRQIIPSLQNKKKKITVVQGRMKCSNGNKKWVEMVTKPLTDEEGNLIGLQGSTRDITERVEAEERLKEKEALLYRSQEIAKTGSWEYIIAENRLIWSDEVYRIFGLDPNEFKPDYESFLQKVHPEDRQKVHRAYSESLEKDEDGYAVEHRITRQNSGEVLYVYEKCEHIRNELGEIIRSVGMVQDITESKISEKALRRSESRYRMLFENAPVGIFKTDSEGHVHEMNPTMARMLEHESVEEAIKYYMNIGQRLYVKPEKRVEFLDLLKKEKFVENFEFEARTRTGHHIFLSMSARMTDSDTNGKFLIEGFTTDITSRKEAEQKLIQQNKEYQMLNEEYISQNNELTKSLELLQKVNQDLEIAREKAEESDRLKTAFLANMSHEIRTPMNAIIGFSNFLSDDISGEEKNRFIGIIQTNANNLLKIIDDVINISRLESENITLVPSSFSIENLFDEIYHSFLPNFESGNIRFAYEIPEDLKGVSIRSDYHKIIQILSGFISNSMKYTENGNIFFGCKKENDQIRFYVEDTGIGIPENEQEKVFERFFRGSKVQKKAIGGTGLGLSIASYLTKMLLGKIELVSEEGKGSTFSILIPLVTVEAEEAEPEAAEVDIDGNEHLQILIVEDEPANQEYIQLLIDGSVKKTTISENGKEALTELTKDHYDLILMDIKMPVMDGLEATRLIRQNNREVVIVAQTAYSQPEEINRAIQAGCNDYLVKPIRKDDLLRIIRKYFGSRNN